MKNNYEMPSHIWLVSADTKLMNNRHIIYAGTNLEKAKEYYKLAKACLDKETFVTKVRIPCDVLARTGFPIDTNEDYRKSSIIKYSEQNVEEPIHSYDWDYQKEHKINESTKTDQTK